MYRRVFALASACGLLLHAPTFALAASTGEDTPLRLPADAPSKLDTSGGSNGIVRTIVGLAVVIGVIYGVAWVLKQVKSSREERTAGFGLETTATIPLGPNRALHLVRAGRELVLVGVAEHGVTPIRTYSEDEARRLGLIPEPGVVEAQVVAPTAKTRAQDLIEKLRERTVRK